VASFDSTSPLLQAFKSDRENYYTATDRYSAIRVPQSEANPKLANKVRAGNAKQETVRRLEDACMDGLVRFERQGKSVAKLMKLLAEYDSIFDGRKDPQRGLPTHTLGPAMAVVSVPNLPRLGDPRDNFPRS
jgi:hypothetical protein